MPDGGDLIFATDAVVLDETACQRISTEIAAGPYLRVSVTDTGCGMDAEIQKRIFEPFFTTKGNHGTGLGLAVSWGIVEAHGGSLEVQSELGHGTTFTLRLSTIAAPEGGSPPSLATLT
jgi:signal transduction histidine kinase